MTLQTAIEKAIEGGWRERATREIKEVDAEFWARTLVASSPVQVYLLDAEFWKALGKSMGWGEKSWCCKKEATRYALDTMPVTYQDRCKCCGRDCGIDGQEWNSYWHDFIDHLAEGKDIESYFESLT